MRPIVRGLLAGAAGTLALNTVGYLDMLVRGRSASSAPAQTAEAALHRLGADLPARGERQANQLEAAGALAGTAVGLGVGAGAGLARSVGLRPGPVLGSAVLGGAAMAATDVPMAVLGVAEPRTWSAADWTSDVVPHLAYGAATHATLTALARSAPEPVLRRPERALLGRSLLLGLAAGSRSSLAVTAPVLSDRRYGTVARTAAALGTAGELVGDKLPTTPSRLQPPVPQSRMAMATTGATFLARRDGARPTLPVLAALAGAAASTWGGAAWRAWAGRRAPDWVGAVAEDLVAIGCAALACRPTSHPAPGAVVATT